MIHPTQLNLNSEIFALKSLRARNGISVKPSDDDCTFEVLGGWGSIHEETQGQLSNITPYINYMHSITLISTPQTTIFSTIHNYIATISPEIFKLFIVFLHNDCFSSIRGNV